MALKRFAQILGVVLILVGLVGLVLGDRVWLGILNVDIVEDIVHLATGGLLAYVGFSQMDLATARSVVLALGAQHREVGAQVRRSEAPEVPLAAKARPLGEDGQRQDLRVAQEGGTAGARCARGVVCLPPVVYVDVQ